MSNTQTTFDQLAALLSGVSPVGQSATLNVFTDPIKQFAADELPCIVLAFDANTDFVWSQISFGGQSTFDYTISIYCILGLLEVGDGLPVLHRSAIVWPEAVAKRLVSNITLSNNVIHTGSGDGTQIRGKITPIKWAGGSYYGVVFHLDIKESYFQTFG